MQTQLTYTLLSLLCFLYVYAQNIERKIILKDSKLYYTTIDSHLQIATLHTVSVTDSVTPFVRLAVPAGRNYREPLNPFCWDINTYFFYAINFVDHPMNNKFNAIKRIPLTSLREWDSLNTPRKILSKSTEQPIYCDFQPYKFIVSKSSELDHFFFDAIVRKDSSYSLVIANKGELSVWCYKEKKWSQSSAFPFNLDHFFTLFEHKGKLFMLQSNGHIYELSMNKAPVLKKLRTVKPLTEGVLLINKDQEKILFIKDNQLNWKLPPKDIIKKAINIF